MAVAACLKTKEMGEEEKRKLISGGEDDVVRLPGGEVDIVSASGKAILWPPWHGRAWPFSGWRKDTFGS